VPCSDTSRFRHAPNHQVQATPPVVMRRRRFGLKIYANGHEFEKKQQKNHEHDFLL